MAKIKMQSGSQKHGRGNFAEQEAASIIATRNAKMDRLVEKWARTNAGLKLDETYARNKRRARHAAFALEMQRNHLKSLSETQISNAYAGVTPEVLLRIVRVGSANANRGEIFTEWPLSTLDDPIVFVDKVYGTTARGATAQTNLYENNAPNYASEIEEEILGAGPATSFGPVVMTYGPIVPGSVRIISNGVLVANDNGAGGFIDIAGVLTGTNTVNYTTKSITMTFSTNQTNVYAEYHWNSEVSTNFSNFGQVEIKLRKERFNARPMPLGYSYTRMVEMQLGLSGVGDAEDMLVQAVGDEHAMRKDYKAIQLAKRVSGLNTTYTFDADFAAAGEDNDYNHAQRLTTKLDIIKGDIYNALKRGQSNNAIVGTKAASYMKKHKLWVPDNSQPRVGGTYLEGTLDGMKIWTSPADVANGLLADNEVILTYKNPIESGDVSIAFGVVTEMAAALDYPEFYRVGNVASVEDQKIVEKRFIRKLTLNNILD